MQNDEGGAGLTTGPVRSPVAGGELVGVAEVALPFAGV